MTEPKKQPSERKPVVWIAGGHGFIGHEIAYQLQALDYSVILLSRNLSRHTDFRIMKSDYSVDDLSVKFQGNDIVINLIGILNEKGFNGKGFEQAHVDTTAALIKAASAKQVSRFLQMSALHAHSRGPSHYLSSKAKAEDLVTSSKLNFTIFRPSVVFGADDSFTRRFARLLKLSPIWFPLACANAKFQPIHVKNIAQCFVQSLNDESCIGQSYNLCGPDAYSLKQIVELITQAQGKHKRVIALSPAMSKAQAMILQLMPGKPFTMDNYKSLQIDSICHHPQELPFQLDLIRLKEAITAYLK